MKRILLLTIVAANLMIRPVRADVQTVNATATAYNLTGLTASNTQTEEGRTIAGKREWFGKVLVLWEDPDRSGQIKSENYIGTYICEDIGGATIQSGQVVDIYISDLKRAKEFGSKKVIIQIIDSEG